MNELWEAHAALWRDPAQVATQWADASSVDPSLLRHRTSGRWWDTLATLGITLLVTREYEHLVISMCVRDGRPHLAFLPMPHPSGLAVDRQRGVAHLASTRNPNQVYDLAPATGFLDRPDVEAEKDDWRPLVPVRSRFLPGALYLHDLALVGGRLHGNAVGQNAVVELRADGSHPPVWWPRCVDRTGDGGPLLSRNHLQLNSIAAGPDLARSYFSASTDEVTFRRPGQRNFPVDRRGVVFAGTTREPAVSGLTRPHSARLHEGRVWVANSGYGELVVASDSAAGAGYEVAATLPGWTRGLCFVDGIAFVATSRVIPRFRRYAPGLDVGASACAVHAVEVASGAVVGSLVWPSGNQVFALDWFPASVTTGFPFAAHNRRARRRERNLFYGFTTARDCDPSGEETTNGP